jgi:hypothetical protein
MRTSVRYTFKGRTPAAFVVIFVLLVVNFWAGDALMTWGWVPSPDALHSYGIRFRGGVWRYYQPAVGWYVDELSFWLQGFLMAAAAFVLWLRRDQIEKVEVPPPSGPVSRWEWLSMLIGVPAAYSLVGGVVISILLREAGWTAALVTVLLFLTISLATVILGLRPLIRRSPPPLEWPAMLGLAAALTLAALAIMAVLFERFG